MLSNRALASVTFYPYWLDTAGAPKPEAPLIGKTETDLLIVGGGFTGLWAAIIAKEANPERDVLLIEAETIASGASGRPGAIVSTSVMHGLHNAIRIFPRDLAQLEVLGQNNIAGFLRTIAQHQIDCDAEWNGELTVAVGRENLPTLREEYELHRTHGHEVQLLDAQATRAEVNSPLFEGALWARKNSGTLHPAKLAWGLKRAALSLGVRIHEHSPLKRLEDEGNAVTVTSRDGEIRARQVLLATNAFAAGHDRIKKRVAMVRDRILMTEPLTPEQMDRIGWRNRQGIYDTRTQLNYMRLTRDNRILFGGRLGYFYGSPRDPELDRTPAPYGRLADAFFRTFPQLDDIRFTHAWSGPIALTTRMAVHFQTYHGGKMIYAGGYSGFGVSASRFGAEIGLAKLAGSERPELNLEFARTMPNVIPPEPFRYLGACLTMHALDTADSKGGWRKLWLKIVGSLGFPLS
ncbi:FAD-dependent oxidoreductase [Rhizobium lusitanum]|uniref:FAD-dependent oxidoreductase n=1 Tax=Rhizobium lusitanum TaxID=293958 RepID=A0A6L9UJ61_9HYPH|nr:FAD-dependent oxidoreductase [Rhizobium lusitanum]NEI73920.1 FAD-dependent oxidoreductase [Rhizobium lusitanum]